MENQRCSGILTLVTLTLIISMFSCSEIPGGPDDRIRLSLSAEEKELIRSGNEFGFDLFKTINEEPDASNIFISPLSVSMALGMTYNGADGDTREAMKATLRFNDLTDEEINESYKNLIELLFSLDPEVALQLANSIWGKEGVRFEEAFLNACRIYFDAEVRSLDFGAPEAVDIINGWIEEKTNGLIKDTLEPPIPPNAVMYLINAIYFKGTWTYQFDEEDTREDTFYPSEDSEIPIKMMSIREEFPYYENDSLQMVDLPYGNGDFSMTIILPKRGYSIDDLIAGLTDEDWKVWTTDMAADTGNVYLPRFKNEYKTELGEPLIKMGMKIAFGEGADFGKMRSERDIFISRVIHQSFVEVNEEGTEAAAVTVVEMSYVSVEPPKGFTIRINRPFFFVIRENQTGTIMFMGKITEPVDS